MTFLVTQLVNQYRTSLKIETRAHISLWKTTAQLLLSCLWPYLLVFRGVRHAHSSTVDHYHSSILLAFRSIMLNQLLYRMSLDAFEVRFFKFVARLAITEGGGRQALHRT